MIPNCPPGWGGFIVLRRTPMTPLKEHENRKHGYWTRAVVACARELRLILRWLRIGGRVQVEVGPGPFGWRGFIHAMNRRASAPK
jgi:hypothetical protein